MWQKFLLQDCATIQKIYIISLHFALEIAKLIWGQTSAENPFVICYIYTLSTEVFFGLNPFSHTFPFTL